MRERNISGFQGPVSLIKAVEWKCLTPAAAVMTFVNPIVLKGSLTEAEQCTLSVIQYMQLLFLFFCKLSGVLYLRSLVILGHAVVK